jgi:hypothetical protein
MLYPDGAWAYILPVGEPPTPVHIDRLFSVQRGKVHMREADRHRAPDGPPRPERSRRRAASLKLPSGPDRCIRNGSRRRAAFAEIAEW